MRSQGFGSEETKAAFTRVRELADGVGSAGERYATYYGLWASSAMQGDFASALDIAESLLREAESEERQPEASAAQRMVGFTYLRKGDFIRACDHLEEALKIYNAQSQHDSMLRLGGVEPGPAAMSNCVALARWVLGDIPQATHQMDEAISRALDAGHIPTLAHSRARRAELEILCGNADAAFRAAEAAFVVSREHEFGHYLPMATVYLGWACARLGQREAGMQELRKGLAAHTEQGNKAWTPFFQGTPRRGRSRHREHRRSLYSDQRSSGAGARDWRTLGGRFFSPHSWRNVIEARSNKHGAGRECFSHGDRNRRAAEGSKLRASRRPIARETLSIDRPPRRRARCSGTRGRRLFADAGIPGDRGSTSAALRTAVMSQSKKAATSGLRTKRKVALCRS